MNKIRKAISSSSKTEKFLMIIMAIAIVSSTLTFIIKEFIYTKDKEIVKVLLVTPKSSNPNLANSMREGTNTYISMINNNRYGNYKLEIDELDENAPNFISNLELKIKSNDYKGIVGLLDTDIFSKNKDKFLALKLPLYSLAKASNETLQNTYFFNYQVQNKAQFVANYMRNVKKERIAYFAHDNSFQCNQELEEFTSVYNRFKIPLSGIISTNEDIKEYFSKVDFGAVYICGKGKNIAHILNNIEQSGTDLTIYSNEELALNSTKEFFQNPADRLNDITVTTPLLFDTAHEEAQAFSNTYKNLYKKDPDWLSSIMYDITKIAFENSLYKKNQHKGVIQEYNLKEQTFHMPIKIGEFNGEQLISAPIQLQEIENKKAIDNYIQALRENRVLYVNDSFMYKTNVVYTGININSIKDIRQNEGTVQIDFSIWFRYQGSFDPSDIMFLNSDIILSQVEEKIDKENDHYIRYRANGKFKMNFSQRDRVYGVNTINIIYRHKKFNNNNLLFVTDILGMPSNKEMLKEIKQRKIIEAGSGWEGREFWISQNLMKDFGEGKPQFVGYKGEKPLFSKVNVELEIHSSMISAKDVIPKHYFIFLFVLGLVGLISAYLMDSKKLGQYWYVQSFVLRLLFIPMFFISGGNMLLDWAYINLNEILISDLIMIYESIWWLVPAYLINLAVKRFIWNKIEEKADKKIPNIIVLMTSFVIYALAISGIIAFVFKEELTSILAASGVMAMVIGMAIKTNIANVFSGLIINMDRPFKVGERIVVKDMSGDVIDIGWRTTTIETWDGVIVRIPNEQISDSIIKNDTRSRNRMFIQSVYFSPDVAPEKGIEILKEAVFSENVNKIVDKEDEEWGIILQYMGVELREHQWVSHFRFYYCVRTVYHKKAAVAQVWKELYHIFKREKIPMYSSQPVIENNDKNLTSNK